MRAKNISLPTRLGLLIVLCWTTGGRGDETEPATVDRLRALQQAAYDNSNVEWGHWGIRKNKYNAWKDHSNRLIPVYTFGIGLGNFTGAHSVYRNPESLKSIYSVLPERTLNKSAEYLDQTDIYRLQKLAVETLNKKFVFLIIFDGMDWQTTQAASIYKLGEVAYASGRGTGLAFQDYHGTSTDFGYMVTSAYNGGMRVDVDTQRVIEPAGDHTGGYCQELGGDTPWSKPASDRYLLCNDKKQKHIVTDSSSSATSMTCGIKTFNGAINVTPGGDQVQTIAAWLQAEKGYAIGAVTSVPISHATPACAYANNVSRGDYQDLSRDLLGLPSISHPQQPLDGLDVLIGCGWGENSATDEAQGTNYVAGNRYLTEADLRAIDQDEGGKYVVAQRTPGRPGSLVLQKAVETACREKSRLFGFFGQRDGHLAFRTADGSFNPLRERYEPGDITESPRLAEMTKAAIDVLKCRSDKFWLMIEAGDVDWANHANNIDDSIGAVFDGDDAFQAVTNWIESNNAWEDAVVIVTADHGHYFVLEQPEAIIDHGGRPAVQAAKQQSDAGQ
jgi:alkaline phosphatase